MDAPRGGILEGLSPDDRGRLERELERRTYPAGSVILAEGDAPRVMFIVRSGSASVSVLNHLGEEQIVSTIFPGECVGEMSLLTGQPVSATVRADEDVEALVLGEADFDRLFTAFPLLYRNLGSVLSSRLVQTTRQAAHRDSGKTTLLINSDAPALMGYALACSVAWHSRRPTLYIRCSAGEPDARLQRFVSQQREHGVSVILTRPDADFAPDQIRQTLDAFDDRFAHILLEIDDANVFPALDAASIVLAGRDSRFNMPDQATLALRGWQAPAGNRVGPDEHGLIQVPEPADLDELTTGMLSTSTPSGKQLGWVARDITGTKVGLALGAGSIKGYAHVGVLQVLEERNIPVDYLAGTSVGAAIASAYAAGYNPLECAQILDDIGKGAFKFGFSRHGILSSSSLRDGIRAVSHDQDFEDLRLPLTVIAADIVSGREVVFARGKLWPAVLASMAIPGIYPPVPIGDYMLVDGGVVNPVPGDAVSNMGANTVIAVKLGRRAVEDPIDLVSGDPSGRPPLLVQTLNRSIDIMQGKIVTESAAASTITIEPVFPAIAGWGLRSFSEGRAFIEAGRKAAETALPRLAATAIPWLRDEVP